MAIFNSYVKLPEGISIPHFAIRWRFESLKAACREALASSIKLTNSSNSKVEYFLSIKQWMPLPTQRFE